MTMCTGYEHSALRPPAECVNLNPPAGWRDPQVLLAYIRPGSGSPVIQVVTAMIAALAMRTASTAAPRSP